MTAIALIAWTTIPAWPVVGVAFAAAALVVNTAAARLKADRPLCLSCGHDLSGVPTGQYGRMCPSCGGINQPYMVDATVDATVDAAGESPRA